MIVAFWGAALFCMVAYSRADDRLRQLGKLHWDHSWTSAMKSEELQLRSRKKAYEPVIGVLLVLSVGLIVGYFILRAEARRIEAAREMFSAGRYLVRWRYTHADWLAFVIYCRNAQTRRCKLLQPDQPMECYISTVAAFANGEWLLWGTPNRRLVDVKLVGGQNHQPLMLSFTFQVDRSIVEKLVLVPARHADLAETVARHVLEAHGSGSSIWLDMLRGGAAIATLLR